MCGLLDDNKLHWRKQGMKVNRVKTIKRITSFYSFAFKLDMPLRVYLHHSIVSYCLEKKLDLKHLLESAFQQPIKVTTLKCSKYLTIDKSVKKEMKKYFGHECLEREHGEDCFSKVQGVMCIQDHEIRQQLNVYKCVPFMYFNNTTLVMEPISDIAKEKATKADLKSRKSMTAFEKDLLGKHVEIDTLKESNELGYKGKMPQRRKIKGPNPLSCKSKKIVKKNRRKNKIDK